MSSNRKPLILMSVAPFTGHMAPLRIIAAALVQAGYDVFFMAPNKRRAWIEVTGATALPLVSSLDHDEAGFEALWKAKGRLNQEPGLRRLLWDLEHVFLHDIPAEYESVQNAMKYLTTTYPQRQIIIVNEGFYLGIIPMLLDAPGLKASAVISIGIVPVVMPSCDTPPAGSGLLPDSSSKGRIRNEAAQMEVESKHFGGVQEIFQQKLTSLGAQRSPYFMFASNYRLPDAFLQMCIREMEYPRSDSPAKFSYAGVLPVAKDNTWEGRPSWWNAVVVETNKKIIFVCQGTAAKNYFDLVKPTIDGLADRDDINVIVALGQKGASLPIEWNIAYNVWVEDYVPYQEILPFADVFVTNGGYGGVMQAVTHGVPLVVAGTTEDKTEVSARVAWSGLGVNLKVNSPSPQAVTQAVDEVLADSKYRERSKELMQIATQSDPIARVIEAIEEHTHAPITDVSVQHNKSIL